MFIDYESGTLIPDGVVLSGPPAKNALTLDCRLSRTGACSAVSLLAPNADYVSAGAHRSETYTMHVKRTLYSPGEHYRYRFSLFIPSSWITDSRDSIDTVWQFKRFGRKADMFLTIKGDALVWRITDIRQIVLLKPLRRGRWLDFEVDVFWSENSDGKTEIDLHEFADRVRRRIGKFSYHGGNMWDAARRAGYVGWGLYKPGRLENPTFIERFVAHDDIAIDQWRSGCN